MRFWKQRADGEVLVTIEKFGSKRRIKYLRAIVILEMVFFVLQALLKLIIIKIYLVDWII